MLAETEHVAVPKKRTRRLARARAGDVQPAASILPCNGPLATAVEFRCFTTSHLLFAESRYHRGPSRFSHASTHLCSTPCGCALFSENHRRLCRARLPRLDDDLFQSRCRS